MVDGYVAFLHGEGGRGHEFEMECCGEVNINNHRYRITVRMLIGRR
jgi:hypothetical protein